jgi:hypothetical protein
MAEAAAKYVFGAKRTSPSRGRSLIVKPILKASLPFATPIAKSEFTNVEKSSSNFSTFLPKMNSLVDRELLNTV